MLPATGKLCSIRHESNALLGKFVVHAFLGMCPETGGRVASDEDLKLSDTLRYYMRDSAAAKDLLYRRTRSLADYEAANKALEKARTKNKDVAQVSTPPYGRTGL